MKRVDLILSLENVKMKKLIKYLKTHIKYKLCTIKRDYLTQEVKDVLSKYGLTLHELCYKIKKDIPLSKTFKCKTCGKITMLSTRGYKKFCNRICSNLFTNSSMQSTEKRKQTSIKRYGVPYYTQTKELKNFIKEHNDEIRSKMKTTLIKKYNVDNYSKTTECQQKVYNTKTKNKTHTKSKQEEKAYNLLLTKFSKNDIIRHYKSKLYPFQCDFYIKSLDLYIEYNGYWTHGWDNNKCLGSFDKSNKEHILVLQKWNKKMCEINFKNQLKSQYEKAIKTWTVLDPLKLKTAKDNKLNYKVFWTVKEVEGWLKKLTI